MEHFWQKVIAEIPVASIQFAALVLILVSWRLSRWTTRWEEWRRHIDVKLGLREGHGNGEKYARVVTKGDLLEFDKSLDLRIKGEYVPLARCRLIHGEDGP
jgi:hypothetical protein